MYANIVSWKNMYVLILNLVKTTLIRIGFVQFLQHAGLLATLKILNFPMCTVVEWGDFSRPLSACVAHFRILTTPYGTEDCVLHTCKTSHFMLLLALYLYLWAAWWKKYGYYILGLVSWIDVSSKKKFINKR